MPRDVADPLSRSCSDPFRWRELPVDTIVYSSPSLRIGAFRCPVTSPLFEDSGPIDNHIFVFPRRTVVIEHEHEPPFLADPLLATLYNRGQRYRRRRVGNQPDLSDWFALSPSILEEITPGCSSHPFARSTANADREAYVRQRRLFNLARAGAVDDLTVVEEASSILASLLAIPADREPTSRDHALASSAREWIASRFTQNDSLQTVARGVNSSPFHLARVFRRVYGSSIGAFREELRMRAALGRITSTSLSDLALDLGYSSHAHFTFRFRKMFGTTPAAMRTMIVRDQSPESTSKASAIMRGGAHR